MSRFTCKTCGKPAYESTIFGWRHHNIAHAFINGMHHQVDPIEENVTDHATKKTDIERFLQMLQDWHIPHYHYASNEGEVCVDIAPTYLVEHWVKMDAEHNDPNRSLSYMAVNPEVRNTVDGYGRFFASWVFSTDGKFLRTGAWE